MLKNNMSLLKKSIAVIFSIYLILYLFDIDDIVFSKITNMVNSIIGNKSLFLEKYEVVIEAKEVESVSDNLSGIAYNPNTKTLFAIQNNPRKIYELTLDGELIRAIKLRGFKDTEGISFVTGQTFAIVDERLKTIFLIDINKDTKEIHRKDVEHKLKLDNDTFENFGYEGIAYNKNKDEFYIVNEKFPVETITVSNWLSNKSLSIIFGNSFSSGSDFSSDLSGIHYDLKSNHVLLLSDESSLLTEVDLNGNKLSFMELEKGFLGLKENVPQAEGVTIDEENNIYIVSEPNLFYKFTKNKISNKIK